MSTESNEKEERIQRELKVAMDAGMELSTEDALGDQLSRMEKRNSRWMMSSESERLLESARKMRKSRPRQAVVQSIPIVCRAEACEFRETCPLFRAELAPLGERCPIEIAALEDLFDRYCKEFDLNPEDEGSTVDLMMIKELVDTDIMIIRCDNKLAIDADFIVENTVGMSENGDPLVRKELHVASTYKGNLMLAKYKTLQLLSATRRDKGDSQKAQMSEQERIAEMMAIVEANNQKNKIEDERRNKFLGKPTEVIEIPDLNQAGVIEAEYVEEED